jgi:hypothetical protein
MPMMAISICSRTLVLDHEFSLLQKLPPKKTLPPGFYVAVIFARLPRKPLPQSGTNHLHFWLTKKLKPNRYLAD